MTRISFLLAYACVCVCAIEVTASAASIPTPDRVLIVIEENHSYSTIIGNPAAPYINSLAANGALFTNSFGVAVPSQPNYLALFSGSTQGVTDNNYHGQFAPPNLASELAAVGKTFAGYFESMSYDGFDGTGDGIYVRKHNPVTQFTNTNNATYNKVFNATHFPTASGTDYSFLPTVSMVVPNQNNDMHNGSIATADAWLATNLGAYITWAQTHNSLLIFTFDEAGGGEPQIPTFFYGPMVQPGLYSETINHYNVLRTIEEMYGTAHANNAANATPITNVWLTAESVPEPSTCVLALPGLIVLGVISWWCRFRSPRVTSGRRHIVAGIPSS